VYDPQTDEEGCFGWVGGKIERLSQVTISDRRGGEQVLESSGGAPVDFHPATAPASSENDVRTKPTRQPLAQILDSEPYEETSNDSLLRLTAAIFSYLTVLILGALISWFFFPRIELVPVPVDPLTGKPLAGYSMSPAEPGSSESEPSENGKPDRAGAPIDHSKENHGGSK
jgi:hypothetical protein